MAIKVDDCVFFLVELSWFLFYWLLEYSVEAGMGSLTHKDFIQNWSDFYFDLVLGRVSCEYNKTNLHWPTTY